MPPEAVIDVTKLDFGRLVVDQEGIRRINTQRFEMEQLNGIVLIDHEQKLIVGYKDVADDEFWVRGHMPGYPLLPGVLMCEAGAQLCSYYSVISGLVPDGFIGFGGMEKVRFRGVVRPGDRLVLVAKALKLHRRQTIFTVQGFVGAVMVFQAEIIGVPMTRAADAVGGA